MSSFACARRFSLLAAAVTFMLVDEAALGFPQVDVCALPEGRCDDPNSAPPLLCRYGCYHSQMNSGCLDRVPPYFYSLHANLHWAWLPPDFPPTGVDVEQSTSPLVSGQVRHFRGPTPHAERPTFHGVVDMVTGAQLLREVDFELPFGSAVFRHIRTRSDSWMDNDGCAHGGLRGDHLWDWNGDGWMMGENPLFLFDAAPFYNKFTPRKCYFIPDAHHAIPFELVADGVHDAKYVAPPWFDAILEHNGTLSNDGTWTTMPSEFRLWLHRRSVEYTITIDPSPGEQPHFPPEMHEPAESPDCNHADGLNARGVPYIGRVTRVEDRYGNFMEYYYCTAEEFACSYDTTICEHGSCSMQCKNCNEVGQLKAIKLRRTNDNGEEETVWTLLYTHRAFGDYCKDDDEPSGACPSAAELPDPCNEFECTGLGDDLNGGATRNRRHMLHTIHVYPSDVPVPEICLTLPFQGFCADRTLAHHNTAIHPAVAALPANWTMELRYLYAEQHDGWGNFACPAICAYRDSDAIGWAFPAITVPHMGAELLKVTTTRKDSAGISDSDHTIYRYTAAFHTHNYGHPCKNLVRTEVAVFEDATIDTLLKAQREAQPTVSVDVDWILNLPADASVFVYDPEDGTLITRELGEVYDLFLGSQAPPSSLDQMIAWLNVDPQRTFLINMGRTLVENRRDETEHGVYKIYHLQQYPEPTETVAGCPDAFETPYLGSPERTLLFHGAAAEIKYPFRYQTRSSQLACEGQEANYYKNLMANDGGGKAFHILVIDELTSEELLVQCDEDEIEALEAYSPADELDSNPRGIVTRRVIELNAAGFLLRDRTWAFKECGLELTNYEGYGEEPRYDCVGRVVERRTSGWTIAASQGASAAANEGLIYVYEYEDDMCSWDAEQDRCDCAQVEVSLGYTPGQLKAAGVKRGTTGPVQFLRRFERNPVWPELVIAEVDYPHPETDPNSPLGNRTEYQYVCEADAAGGSACDDPEQDAIIEKRVIRPAARGGVEAPLRFAVEKERYSPQGNLLFRGTGSLVDPQNPGDGADEFFVDVYTFDEFGRPTEEILDANPSIVTIPNGFACTDCTQADPLHLRTKYYYDPTYGLTGIDFPNGRKQRHVYKKDEANDAMEYWIYKDLDWPDGANFKPLSPVEISYVQGSKLIWTKQVDLPESSLDSMPSGNEAYTDADVVKLITPEYDAQGRIVEVKQTGQQVPADGAVKASIQYGAFGSVERQADPSGTITRMVYDQRGRPEKTYRGTRDEHEFWGTASPPAIPCEQGDYDDNLLLIEKRYYGTGVHDAGRLNAVRRYDSTVDNQYFEDLGCCAICNGDEGGCWNYCPGQSPPVQINNNEDSVGRREEHGYDWRMRDVRMRQYDESGNPIHHTFTWLDHLDRTVLSAEYGASAPVGSPIDPTTLSLTGDPPSAQAVLSTAPAPVALTEYVYNARGRVERTLRYDVGDLSGGTYLESRTYLNHRDQPVEVDEPNVPPTQYVYDSKGRRISARVVVANGSGGVTELSRTDSVYDANDREIRTIRWDREHDATGDVLGHTNAVASFTHTWFDKAGRITATADYGTTHATYSTTGATMEPEYDPADSPAGYRTDGVLFECMCPPGALCTCYGYDQGGRQNSVFHPDGTQTYQEYDGLGRLLMTIENYGDEDKHARRVTAHKYDAGGRLSLIAAVLPTHRESSLTDGVTQFEQVDWDAIDGTLQVTKLVYGAQVVDAAGNVKSEHKDWVAEVRYPSPETGQPFNHYPDPPPQGVPPDRLTFQYYFDGSVASRVDQRGTRIEYTYDDLGRRIETTIDDSAWYTGAQGAVAPAYRVHRIQYHHNAKGDPYWVTAYTGLTSPQSIVAENNFVYDSFGNLIRERQSHIGGLHINSPAVDYDWETSSALGGSNQNRLLSLTYPTRYGTTSRRTVTFGYGSTSGGIDDALNRVTEVSVPGLAIPNVALYGYTGASRKVVTQLGCGINQSLEGADGYAGLDGFGRLIDLDFKLGNDTVHRYQYGFDAAGNQTFNRTTQAAWNTYTHDNDRSYLYAYDKLHRLVSAQMGALNSLHDAILPNNPIPTTASWDLDNLGNWSGDATGHASVVRTGDFNGDGDVDPGPPDTTSLHHNVDLTNRITGLIKNNSFPQLIVHDWAGNLVFDGTYVYQYDGLNRLVQVNLKGSAVLDQMGNGRITGGTLGPMIFHHVYDGLGRVIRKDYPESTTDSRLRYEDYYHDGIRRVQDVIKRQLAAPPPDPCDEIGLTKSGALVAGVNEPTIAWFNEEGDAIGPVVPPCDSLIPASKTTGPTFETWTDREYVYAASSGSQVDEFILQIDRTGAPLYMLQDANLNVVGLVGETAEWQVLRQDVYSPYGEVAATDFFSLAIADNKVGHHGMFFDRFAENAADGTLAPGAPGLYHYRNRTYSPTLGRFVQRDPNGAGVLLLQAAMNGESVDVGGGAFDLLRQYTDGLSLYQFLRSSPTTGLDPLGTTFLEQLVTAGNRALQAMSAYDNAKTALNLARALVAGVGFQQVLLTALVEAGTDKLGGKVFDRALDGLKGIAGLARKGVNKVAQTLLKGQIHHAISKKIWRALEKHPKLKGLYRYQDSRFVTKAAELKDHKGYQKWHRELDDEIAEKLASDEAKDWVPSDFENYLQQVYSRRSLEDKFPLGLVPEAWLKNFID